MMKWKLVIGALLLVTSYALAQDNACIDSFPPEKTPPNHELMNAMYVADPDVDTGRIVFTPTGEDTMNGVLAGNSLSYSSWLAKSRDARKDMANLWFYLARLVTTNLLELAQHYKVATRLGTNKPRGVIDFSQLYQLFNTVCTQYNATSFWLTCFDKEFYCSFKEVFTRQQVVIKTGSALKSIEDVISMSAYGIDDSDRAVVLSHLFNPAIIKFIPEQTRRDVFYQSDLVFDSIDNMLLSREYFTFWVGAWSGRSIQPVRAKMITQCSSDASSTVSQEYYCVGKRFMDKIEACSQLTTFDVCLFDPLVQEYFSAGTFDNVAKLRLLPRTIDHMRDILGEFNNLPLDGMSNERNELIQKYSPYISTDNSACSVNWMRRFDCEKNFGCATNLESELQFDCNGGSTCKSNTIYRFDCMINFLLKPTQRLASSTSNVRQEEAAVWLAYPPMVQFYPAYTTTTISSLVRAVQSRAKPLALAFKAAELATFMQYFPKVNFVPFFMYKMACVRETVEIRYVTFCNVHGLFESINMYLDIFNRQASGIVVLNPTTNYVQLINSLVLANVKDFLNAQLAFYFNDITTQLETSFSGLSNYFSSLAEFDKSKLNTDIAFVASELDSFKAQIAEHSQPIRNRFIGLFTAAFVAVAADIAMKAAMLAANIAEACNPLKFIFGGGSAQDIVTSLNDMLQAVGNLVGLARLLADVIPVLTMGHKISSAFDQNAAQLANVKELMDGLQDPSKDMTTESNTFLGWYDSYTPALQKSNITDYTTKLEAFSAQLCERAFAGSTSAAALVEMGIASTGVCNLLGPQILKLGVIYEEIYDYQFIMVDTLAAAVRAYLASSKATSMTSQYQSNARFEVDFVSRMALNSLIVSTVHIWTIVTEYCNHLTYIDGGNVPQACTDASQAPSDNNIARVLALEPSTCFVNNEITDHMPIPTKPMPYTDAAARSRDRSYIDLNELYAGNVVEFEIPNLQWLRDNNWFQGITEKAMFVKRFNLYLTPMNMFDATIEVTVTHGANVKLAENAPTTYILPIKDASDHSFRYKEQTPSCVGNRQVNPYNVCDTNITDICVISDGLNIRSEITSTVFNRWKIQATILPYGATAPQPTTDLKLKATITYCEINLAAQARGKRDANQPEDIVLPRQKRQNRAWCCPAYNYWNAASTSCAACPPGSTPQLDGYYCQ